MRETRPNRRSALPGFCPAVYRTGICQCGDASRTSFATHANGTLGVLHLQPMQRPARFACFSAKFFASQAALPHFGAGFLGAANFLSGSRRGKNAQFGTFGQGVCATDGTWTILKSPHAGLPLYLYSTSIFRPLIVDNPVDGRLDKPPNKPVDQGYFDPSVDLPMWKIPIHVDPRSEEDHLYHRAADPDQKANLWQDAPEQRDQMLGLMRTLMDEEGFPPEQLARLGLEDRAAPAPG